MKVPRVTVATVGFAVAVIAINLAVVKGAWAEAFDPNSESWLLTASFFLPMIDVLLMSLFRLRRRERRTPGPVGFVAAGSVATGLLFASALLAPWTVSHTLWRLMVMPMENFIEDQFIQIIADTLMWGTFARWKVSCGIELLLEMAALSMPPLLIALLGGRVASRLWTN
jgi:hypothetical protein